MRCTTDQTKKTPDAARSKARYGAALVQHGIAYLLLLVVSYLVQHFTHRDVVSAEEMVRDTCVYAVSFLIGALT